MTPTGTDGRKRGTETSDPFGSVIRRTRLGMGIETVLRAFWPVAAFLAALWAALAFGLAEIMSRTELRIALAVALVVTLALLLRGARRLRLPTGAEAQARVDATLPGRPLQALADTQALGRGDPEAQAVWTLHQHRMARLAADARAVPPDLRLARFDPFALRLAAIVAVLAALVFARDPAVESLTAALTPSEATALTTGPSFEAWAAPPPYTGRPTLYLAEVTGETPLSLPQGTRVTLRAYGDAARFSLTETVSGDTPASLAPAAPGIATAEFDLLQDGRVSVAEDDTPLASWSFVAEPDMAPAIEPTGPVTSTAAGETSLGFTATDDHGVTGARAEITLDHARIDRRYGLAADPEPRPAIAVELPLPMSRAATEVTETLIEDFSEHPWVGLPVTIRLLAEDAAGQIGTSEGIAAELPGRRFYNPTAAALVEQRRDLLWSAANARRVVQVLRAITWRPEGAFDNTRAYLITRTAIRRLDAAEKADTVAAGRDEIAGALWQAALLLEEGSLGDAAERLARAQERLREALRGDASDAEIAQLMDELRQATRDYMEQMAREAIERGESQRAEIPPDAPTMSQDQIQQLMDRIQELSDQGRKAEAEALLEMLQQMLENMQMMMAEGGQGQGEGNQSMQGLADALREQQDLADESFQQLQREFQRGMEGQQGQGGDSQDQDMAGQLGQRQEALRQLLEELRQNMPGDAGEASREALREAERNMGEARDGLEEGNTSGALDRQAEAIDNLREGMRALGEELRQAQSGQGQEGEEDGQSQTSQGEDPLGRPLGSQGSIGSDERMLQDLDATARARAILDEIRRRAGDLARPEAELDYLRRLLDRF